MWGVLKEIFTLVDKVFGMLESLSSKNAASKKADIGYDLFMVYSEANNILIVGDRIVRCLENFTKTDHTEYSGRTLPNIQGVGYMLSVGRQGIIIDGIIDIQMNNIDSLFAKMRHLSVEMKIIDGDFYRIINSYLEGKLNRLADLRSKVRSYPYLLNDDNNRENFRRNRVILSNEHNKKVVLQHLSEAEPRRTLDPLRILWKNIERGFVRLST